KTNGASFAAGSPHTGSIHVPVPAAGIERSGTTPWCVGDCGDADCANARSGTATTRRLSGIIIRPFEDLCSAIDREVRSDLITREVGILSLCWFLCNHGVC